MTYGLARDFCKKMREILQKMKNQSLIRRPNSGFAGLFPADGAARLQSAAQVFLRGRL
jgi:hypothetical protein